MNLIQKIKDTVVRENEVRFFYLGQEGYVIRTAHTNILIDVYLSGIFEPDAPYGRQYEAPVRAEDLDFADLVLCTHDHEDHTDYDTLIKIASANPETKFILPAAYAHKLIECGVAEERVLFAHEGRPIIMQDAAILPLASAHEELHRDANGDYFEMGYRMDLNGVTVYHAGDGCVYDGLKEKVGKVDVCMLPINGRSYYRLHENIIGNMNLEEAIKFSADAEAKLFVPMHFDLFRANSVPAFFIPASVEIYAPELNYVMPVPGGDFVFTKTE